jgi:hypothetical protein
VSIVGVDKAHRMDAGDFGRMLAKIGHSYTVAQLGLDGFKPVLTNIIRGQRPFFLTHYIGSQVVTTEQGTDLHEVSFDKTGLAAGVFVVVRVRLFATYNTCPCRKPYPAWQSIENRTMIVRNEGSLQAHWLDGCRSDPVAGNA